MGGRRPALVRDSEGRGEAALTRCGAACSCKRARWAARRRRSCRPRSPSGRAATSSRRTCTPSPSAATLGTTPTSGPPPAAPASRRAAAPRARPRRPCSVLRPLQSSGGRAPAPGTCADLRGSAAQHEPADRASVPHPPLRSASQERLDRGRPSRQGQGPAAVLDCGLVQGVGQLRGWPAPQVGQPVGVQGLAQAATEWYGRDRRFGMGRRECKYLPLHIQARARACMSDRPGVGHAAMNTQRVCHAVLW
jgi:hypothetical protein